MRRADAHRALLRALAARYPELMVLTSRAEPWASATFNGARHEMTCAGPADLTGVEEAEFDLPGHVVADVSFTRSGDVVLLEALTIEVD